MDNATTSSLIERWKTSTSSSRRLLKYSRLLTIVISSLRASKRGGVSGLKAHLGSTEPPLPWEDHARPSSIEDHQVRNQKYWGPNYLRTKNQPYKDQEPTFPKVSAACAGELRGSMQILWKQGEEAQADRCSWNTILVQLQWSLKHGLNGPRCVNERMRIVAACNLAALPFNPPVPFVPCPHTLQLS